MVFPTPMISHLNAPMCNERLNRQLFHEECGLLTDVGYSFRNDEVLSFAGSRSRARGFSEKTKLRACLLSATLPGDLFVLILACRLPLCLFYTHARELLNTCYKEGVALLAQAIEARCPIFKTIARS